MTDCCFFDFFKAIAGRLHACNNFVYPLLNGSTEATGVLVSVTRLDDSVHCFELARASEVMNRKPQRHILYFNEATGMV